MTLGDILNDPQVYLAGWVFLGRGVDWDSDSEALVLELEEVSPENELDDDAGIPQFALDRQLAPKLAIADVQDIVLNARQQRPNATRAELLAAFKFYMAHDAFIEF